MRKAKKGWGWLIGSATLHSSTMGQLHNRKALEARRKALRNNPTPAEEVLWNCLKGSKLEGRKFRGQHGIGPYIVDFYCPAERLVIEVDGSSHDAPNVRSLLKKYSLPQTDAIYPTKPPLPYERGTG